MPQNAAIKHSLMLVVRLIDTSSGSPITAGGVRFTIDGRIAFPIPKDQGNYVFLGEKREALVLAVTVQGFERVEKEVRFPELDPRMPLLELQMLPVVTKSPLNRILSFEGVLPGIESIDAVKFGDGHVMIREYDSRKKTITVFNPHRLQIDSHYYAVVNPDEGSYELFGIRSRVSDDSFITEQPLVKEFGNHFPVSRVVFGAAFPDGRYYLRVRDSSEDSRWIVRYISGGTENFKTIDLSRPDANILGG